MPSVRTLSQMSLPTVNGWNLFQSSNEHWTSRSRSFLEWAMDKSQFAALADGIFAVAITLLVCNLKLPEGFEASFGCCSPSFYAQAQRALYGDKRL